MKGTVVVLVAAALLSCASAVREDKLEVTEAHDLMGHGDALRLSQYLSHPEGYRAHHESLLGGMADVLAEEGLLAEADAKAYAEAQAKAGLQGGKKEDPGLGCVLAQDSLSLSDGDSIEYLCPKVEPGSRLFIALEVADKHNDGHENRKGLWVQVESTDSVVGRTMTGFATVLDGSVHGLSDSGSGVVAKQFDDKDGKTWYALPGRRPKLIIDLVNLHPVSVKVKVKNNNRMFDIGPIHWLVRTEPDVTRSIADGRIVKKRDYTRIAKQGAFLRNTALLRMVLNLLGRSKLAYDMTLKFDSNEILDLIHPALNSATLGTLADVIKKMGVFNFINFMRHKKSFLLTYRYDPDDPKNTEIRIKIEEKDNDSNACHVIEGLAYKFYAQSSEIVWCKGFSWHKTLYKAARFLGLKAGTVEERWTNKMNSIMPTVAPTNLHALITFAAAMSKRGEWQCLNTGKKEKMCATTKAEKQKMKEEGRDSFLKMWAKIARAGASTKSGTNQPTMEQIAAWTNSLLGGFKLPIFDVKINLPKEYDVEMRNLNDAIKRNAQFKVAPAAEKEFSDHIMWPIRMDSPERMVAAYFAKGTFMTSYFELGGHMGDPLTLADSMYFKKWRGGAFPGIVLITEENQPPFFANEPIRVGKYAVPPDTGNEAVAFSSPLLQVETRGFDSKDARDGTATEHMLHKMCPKGSEDAFPMVSKDVVAYHLEGDAAGSCTLNSGDMWRVLMNIDMNIGEPKPTFSKNCRGFVGKMLNSILPDFEIVGNEKRNAELKVLQEKLDAQERLAKLIRKNQRKRWKQRQKKRELEIRKAILSRDPKKCQYTKKNQDKGVKPVGGMKAKLMCNSEHEYVMGVLATEAYAQYNKDAALFECTNSDQLDPLVFEKSFNGIFAPSGTRHLVQPNPVNGDFFGVELVKLFRGFRHGSRGYLYRYFATKEDMKNGKYDYALAFRGTDQADDWCVNFSWMEQTVRLGTFNGDEHNAAEEHWGIVPRGFYDYTMSILPQIQYALENEFRDEILESDRKLYITGSSLGAATSQLVALLLDDAYPFMRNSGRLFSFGFGTPHVFHRSVSDSAFLRMTLPRHVIANMQRKGSFQQRFEQRFEDAAINSATVFTGKFMGTKYRGVDVIAIGPTLNAFGYKTGGRYCPIECPFSCKWEGNTDPVIKELQTKTTFEGAYADPTKGICPEATIMATCHGPAHYANAFYFKFNKPAPQPDSPVCDEAETLMRTMKTSIASGIRDGSIYDARRGSDDGERFDDPVKPDEEPVTEGYGLV